MVEWIPDDELAIELQTQSAYEMASMGNFMELNLQPISAFKLIALMQLVRRHPSVVGDLREFVDTVEQIGREYFCDCPAILKIIELGARAA